MWSAPLPAGELSSLQVTATAAGPGTVKAILCAPLRLQDQEAVFKAEFTQDDIIDIGAPRCHLGPTASPRVSVAYRGARTAWLPAAMAA